MFKQYADQWSSPRNNVKDRNGKSLSSVICHGSEKKKLEKMATSATKGTRCIFWGHIKEDPETLRDLIAQ